MLASGGGAIVNMASTAGLEGVAGLAGYVAAKHGVVGLTRSAALDYVDWGLRINALAPGPILTERLAGRGVPMQRIGQARNDTKVGITSSPSDSYRSVLTER